MPTTRISENSTTMFMVYPSAQSIVTPDKKAPGMASPTRNADLGPSAKRITIITKITAAITLASKSERKVFTISDWSCRTSTLIVSGQSAFSSSTTAVTSATVLMMFAPERFFTSSDSAGWPLIRAKPDGASKVRRIVATSLKVTTVPSRTLIGIFNTSLKSSISPGTLSAMRPPSDSMAPAAINMLLR